MGRLTHLSFNAALTKVQLGDSANEFNYQDANQFWFLPKLI